MTLLTEPTRIVLAKGYTLPDDADAVAYIAAVEAADGQALETATRMAINSFVKGCKADGIWPAIKASCILSGARTLTGALVPLVGAAPTNFNFVAGDYNRETGLVGDGSTKYLDSNRNNNTDPQNDRHLSVYIKEAPTTTVGIYLGSGNSTGHSHLDRGGGNSTYFTRLSGSDLGSLVSGSIGFYGAIRENSTQITHRIGGSSILFSANSQTPANANLHVFDGSTVANRKTNARLAFYSIGESLNLALLDTRVTDLINAFAAAIP